MIPGINPFRESVGLYPQPIPVPPCDPDFSTVSVAVSCLWLPYIVGALKALTMQATWDTDDVNVMALAIQRSEELLYIFSAAMEDAACATLPIAQDCHYDFESTDAGWIVDPTFGQGNYTSGLGFNSTHESGISQNVLTIIHSFSDPFSLTAVSFVYDSISAGSGANNVVSIYAQDVTGYHLLYETDLFSGVNTVSWSGRQDNADGVLIQMNSGTEPSATFVVESAIIEGLSSGSFSCT